MAHIQKTPGVWRLPLLLLGLVAACGGGSDSGAEGREASIALTLDADGRVVLDGASTCGLPGFQADLMAEIHAARTQARSCGGKAMAAAPALAWSSRLFSAAARHSADMAEHNYFEHITRDGRTAGDRILAEGYPWSYAGENIAAGQTTVRDVVNDWLASPGHCENLMLAEYTEVGVACVMAPAGASYSRYWTMNLGRP